MDLIQPFHLMQRYLRACLAAWLLAWSGVAPAGTPPWPEAQFSYYAENVPLGNVLSDFAANFSLSLAMQPGVAGAVNGRFNAANPTEFLSRLGGVYGFAWYTHGGVLHVSRVSDNTMRAVNLPYGTARTVRQALLELGVLEPRFGWGELPEQRVALVSGPPSYVALVENTLKQLPGTLRQTQVTVFRLKYASAQDRTVNYRDRAILQPGLATVLRQLVAGQRGSGNLGGALPAPSPDAQGTSLPTLAAMGVSAALGGAAATAVPAQAGVMPPTVRAEAEAQSRLPSIQADPRLNALIIQDIPERIAIYEHLVAQLDQPSPLVEIEAMIVDVNSERSRELGINWSLSSNRASFDFNSTTGVIGASVSAGASTIVGGSGGTTLLTNLRMLERTGDARIQSRPSVLTIDNIAALLDLSETFYVRVFGERVANVTPVTAGTTLKVTPRLIDGDNPSIQLTIDIEDGQIEDRQIDSLPTVRRSTVSTQAIVGQDQTLLIAGYASDQNVEAQQKVPVLGDLPGLGLLFSSKTKVVQRRERLFMIKPKVLRLAPVMGSVAPPSVLIGPGARVQEIGRPPTGPVSAPHQDLSMPVPAAPAQLPASASPSGLSQPSPEAAASPVSSPTAAPAAVTGPAN